MACNVFGIPITNSTLEGMPEYIGNNDIRRKDRAHVALNMKNAQSKDTNARTFVENLKKEYGDGVSTLCLVYNATGDTVKFVTNYDWYGHVGSSPFPVRIENGQWGAFLHVHATGAAAGSSGAVVYRGKNSKSGDGDPGDECDWMLSWSNSWNRAFSNYAYTEIREKEHYATFHWNYISNKLYESGIQSSDNWNGCLSDVSTGLGTTAVFEAIMTLQDA